MAQEKLLSKVIGNNVKKLIKERNYTQEYFAYSFGAELRTVSRWLNNGISDIDTLQAIADFLEVDIVDFLKDCE